MRNRKHLTILASVAILFIIATIFSEPTNNEISGAGNFMFPELLDRANDVTDIKIRRNAGELTLTLKNGIWKAKENNDYPADIQKVRELVLGVSNLKRVEPKTRKPENYSRIGLQDISEKHSPSVLIALKAENNEPLAELIIGNSKTSHSDSNKKSYYVRTVADPQTWLADGVLPEKWEAKDWLDINIFEIKRDRIQQVIVEHNDGEKVYIHRENSDIRDFTLDSLKPDEKVTAPFEVNNIATTFTKMTFDDVKGIENSGIGEKPIYTATLTTFDGLVITFQPYKKDDIHLVKYQASYNEATANTNKEKQTAETKSEVAKPETDVMDATAKPESKIKPITKKLLSTDEVKQEIERYNERWNGWLYQLPDFRINNIGKKKADLLKKDSKPVH